jgi:hypothetical protein
LTSSTPGTCSLTIPDVDPLDATHDPDNQPGPFSTWQDPLAGTVVTGPGLTPVTLTAFDGELTGSCTTKITLVDDTKPVVTCPANHTVQCVNGGATLAYTAPFTDNCSAPRTVNCTPSNQWVPVGTTRNVTCSGTDGSQNTTSCGFTVSVVDTLPPKITCPTPQPFECTNWGAQVGQFAAQVQPDTCSSVTWNQCYGDDFMYLGDSIVNCYSADEAWNVGTCEVHVKVQDTKKPNLGNSKDMLITPNNGAYRTVTLSECAKDAVDQCFGPLRLDWYGAITHVTSDELENAAGNSDGNTTNDIVLSDSQTMLLRREIDSNLDGRVYTAFYTVTDLTGNTATGSCKVLLRSYTSGQAVDSGRKYCVGAGC